MRMWLNHKFGGWITSRTIEKLIASVNTRQNDPLRTLWDVVNISVLVIYPK